MKIIEKLKLYHRLFKAVKVYLTPLIDRALLLVPRYGYKTVEKRFIVYVMFAYFWDFSEEANVEALDSDHFLCLSNYQKWLLDDSILKY